MLERVLVVLLGLVVLDAAAPNHGQVVIHNESMRVAADMFVIEFGRRSSSFEWVVANDSKCVSSLFTVEIASSQKEMCAFQCNGNPLFSLRSEEFQLCITNQSAIVYASDVRSSVFGIGKLLRLIDFHSFSSQISVSSEEAFEQFKWVAYSPEKEMRGQMISYRALSNSYDGWDVDMMEQYIRDLAAYGTNFIEMVAPDGVVSSHFPLPPAQMSVKIAEITSKYGLDVWIWWPIPANDYVKDEKAAQLEISRIISMKNSLLKLDALFIPGGDPGGTNPDSLFSFLKLLREKLSNSTQLWVSAQEFNECDLSRFISLCNECEENNCSYLSGVVYGPHTRISLSLFRKMLNSNIKLRDYPDIGHSISCEFPVPNWSAAFALTFQREGYNPRPNGFRKIYTHTEKHADGFGAYSDGSADDVNKFVWAMLGWDSSLSTQQMMRDYANYLVFFGKNHHSDEETRDSSSEIAVNTVHTNAFAQGVIMLEENWGKNPDVLSTLTFFQNHLGCDEKKSSWRLLHACYRAYYDAYIFQRSLLEQAAVDQAKQILLSAREKGAKSVLENALNVLTESLSKSPQPIDTWRSEIFSIADRLFSLIKMKLSVPLYGAAGLGRGASLDSIDNPTTDKQWLAYSIQNIMNMKDESEQLQMIQNVVQRENPGPDGFYDDLGSPGRMPHLIDQNGSKHDFSFFHTTYSGFQEPFNASAMPVQPLAWFTWSQVLYDNVLQLKYENLNQSASYQVEFLYAGDSLGDAHNPLQFSAIDGQGQQHIIQPFEKKPNPIQYSRFNIPQDVTKYGSLILQWEGMKNAGGNGRVCQVAEVFLRKL